MRRRRLLTSARRPRREAWSLGFEITWSVMCLMRAVKSAIWTSDDPQSVSWRAWAALAAARSSTQISRGVTDHSLMSPTSACGGAKRRGGFVAPPQV